MQGYKGPVWLDSLTQNTPILGAEIIVVYYEKRGNFWQILLYIFHLMLGRL